MSTTTKTVKEKITKDNITIKAVRNVRRGHHKEEGMQLFRPGVKLALERSRLLTESYRATEGEPMVLRRARAFRHIVDNMTVYIRDWERVAGNTNASPEEVFWPIEQNYRSFERVVTEETTALLDDQGRAELGRLIEYWKGKSLRDRQKAAFSGNEELEKYWQYEGTFLWTHWSELGVPDYEKLFRIGLSGVIAQAEARLREINATFPADYVEQKEFLEAVIIAHQAAIGWAGRYAEKARELAGGEQDRERRQQLLDIAAACEWVPANPPRTFLEAVQSFWFVHVLTRQVEFPTYGCGARLDVLLGPFYEKDVKEGRLTREEAVDILASLWLKFEEMGQMQSPTVSSIYAGVQLLQSVMVGGVDKQGRDVTNEVSYIVMDASQRVLTLQPSLTLRVHEGTPKGLLLKAIDLIRTGVGYPALFNDKVLIPLLLKWGVPLEDARNYSISGCVYVEVPGKNVFRRVVSYFSLPKCLWWALHQGVDPKTGVQYGAPTPDPAGFTSIDDVMQAYLEQVRFFFEKQIHLEHVTRKIYEEYVPRPFLSGLCEGCIERGQDGRRWAYPARLPSFTFPVGPSNVADALAAIQKLIFEEKRLSMKELVNILDRSWEGAEHLRQMFLSQAPKYGNDDDYADQIAREVHYRTEAVIEEFSDNWGCGYHCDGSAVSATYGLSLDCPATPDGRKNGDLFADATLSPAPGADAKGPTAVLASAAKIDTLQSYNHLLNQKFLPQFLEGANKELFVSYLRSWADLGIPHIQFNVVDKATLLDAQKHPEKHKNLTVRIAGYSAYFVDLSRGMQDHIIARTEQSLC